MALEYIVLPENSLGNLVFIGHEETITRREDNKRIPVSDVYLLSSDTLDTITVTVPTQSAIKGSFFRKEVTLEGLKVVSEPYTRVNSVTGSVDVRVKEILHAEKIHVKGAAK